MAAVSCGMCREYLFIDCYTKQTETHILSIGKQLS